MNKQSFSIMWSLVSKIQRLAAMISKCPSYLKDDVTDGIEADS